MKHLLKVCTLSSKNMCEKLVGWKSLVIAIFASVRKDEEEEKKTKKKKPTFGSSYLGNGWSDFLQIWHVDSPGWRATV